MRHLIISREYPPAPYAAGGIGTYTAHMARLLAERGETVHVVAQQWPGAPHPRESSIEGRLVVHRVPVDEPVMLPGLDRLPHRAILDGLRHSSLPAQAFMWNAAVVAEWLIDHEEVDVVEAQEYEAPAYFLLARRAAGAGSRRRVPLIVHLHSPTEFIFRENGWERSRTDLEPMAAAERHVIRGADAVLCPSRFLAGIAEAHYGLPHGTVKVLPYPFGDTPVLQRDAATWRHGAVCYTGRLEPRKGVGEWLDAAVAISADHDQTFTFIGGDTSWSGTGADSVRASLAARVPARWQSRFVFVDAVGRHDLRRHFQQARMAVVPSRWENFPFACIEAMASGLPVIVSPTGGMAEMVEDGRTGWVAAGADALSLERALRRALATAPDTLARMGDAAAQAIRALCDNTRIVEQSLAFRQQVVAHGPAARDAGALPLPLPDPAAPPATSGKRAALTGDTMTPFEILKAPWGQKVAVLRRALRNPGYVLAWLAWQVRRR